jgi:hypothetical protein
MLVTRAHDRPRLRHQPRRPPPVTPRRCLVHPRNQHRPPRRHPTCSPQQNRHLHGPQFHLRETWTSSGSSSKSISASRITTPPLLPSVSHSTTHTYRSLPSAMTFAPIPHRCPGHHRRAISSAPHLASRAQATHSSRMHALRHLTCSSSNRDFLNPRTSLTSTGATHSYRICFVPAYTYATTTFSGSSSTT